MGIANAQRALEYIRIIAEFITQEQYKNVVQMFGVLNEPLMGIIGRDQLDRLWVSQNSVSLFSDLPSQSYLQSYDIIRNIVGLSIQRVSFNLPSFINRQA